MKLYHSHTSPYARKCAVIIHELGLGAEVEIVAATGSPLDPGSIPVALNPLGKIPLLERPNGPALYDSRVICRFLDDLGQGGLYPAAPRLWESLTLEATADGMLDAALLMVYESRLRAPEARNDAWLEGQWAKITRALDVLEARWLGHLAGPFDIGQIAIGAALGYLDLRHSARGWRDGRPGLKDWFARLSERPSMVATVPVG
jgi:glutathione S-transferase